jgi:hypothetical protein
MSNAKPMDPWIRFDRYRQQNGREGKLGFLALTGPQRRRCRHKRLRNGLAVTPVYAGKGRPTPRRPRRG